MRTSPAGPVVAALVLTLLPAAPALAAPAADTTPPEVHSITFAKSSTTVSGVTTELVEVKVRMTDDSGVLPTDYEAGRLLASPYLTLNTEYNRFVLLRLASGTAQDGIWSGSLPVTSAWSGAVTATHLYAQAEDSILDIDPHTAVDVPTLQVTSSHRPALDITYTPEPLPTAQPFVEHVRAWDTTTGLPWPNLSIRLSDDNGCVEPGNLIVAKTGADGTYQRKLTSDGWGVGHCAWVPGTNQPNMPEPRTMIAADGGSVRRTRFAVGATPAATSAKAGTDVDVNGNVTPLVKGKVLQLQRLYPGNAWRTVSTGRVRDSGRYTLVATPPGKATYSYRVYAPGDANSVGGLSRTFTIRGT